MGKRKHFEESYTLCDYTCWPLAHEDLKRYLPLWKNGRTIKTGTYISWEAVVSHILHMKTHNTKPAAMQEHKWDAEKSLQLVHEAAGRPVLPGAEYTTLAHFKDGGHGSKAYLSYCDSLRAPISAVAISIVGDTCTTQGCTINPDQLGSYKDHISNFFNGKEYNVIKPTRKVKGLPKFKELVVMTLVDNDLPLNKKAKQLFKMGLFGPVLVACINREDNSMCEFTLEQFKTAFDVVPPKKGKKDESVDGLDTDAYGKVQEELATALQTVIDDSTADTFAAGGAKPKKLKFDPPQLVRSAAV